MIASTLDSLTFALPSRLEAGEPPEARGLARDEVRLMVSHRSDDRIVHGAFRDLPDALDAGDALVVNTSGTMNAALRATRDDGSAIELRLSTHLPADLWIVEPRRLDGDGGATKQLMLPAAMMGEKLRLPAGGRATLHVPYRHDHAALQEGAPSRLWIATLDTPCPLADYLAAYGSPIRYSYVKDGWPLSYYQTVYATEIGSAEMPSAGRAFTAEGLTRLAARGIVVAPLLLHTGVASPAAHEPPDEEYYRVPVVRALATGADRDGVVHPGEVWTRLVVTPERGVRGVTALLTGLHEPRSSHLAMLEALAGRDHLAHTYTEALREGYLWHEFGDLHLILE